MTQKVYLLISAIVFLVIAVGHLTRAIVGWDITLAGWTAPHWISLPGSIVAGLLSAWGFVLASRARHPGASEN